MYIYIYIHTYALGHSIFALCALAQALGFNDYCSSFVHCAGHPWPTIPVCCSKYRAAGGNATPGRNALTHHHFILRISGRRRQCYTRTKCVNKLCFVLVEMPGRRRQCYTRTKCVNKCAFFQNTGPPEAVLHPDGMR